MASAGALVEKVAEAHGGLDRWRALDAVRMRVTSGGLAFASKGQGHAMRGVDARVATRGQHVVYEPYPSAGLRGVFDEGAVRIESNEDGSVVARRDDPRPAFRDLRHKLRWDRLDILYFAGYAIWTYASLPFVLTEPGYEVDELPGRRLRVRFPPEVHTHSREQAVKLDERGLIRRHDYTAEPFGGWARAVHYVDDYRDLGDGIQVGTRRRVHPRLPGGRPLRPVVLVWIELEAAAHAGVARLDRAPGGQSARMRERYTVPVKFLRLDDARERGHEIVLALAAELDVPEVTDPDDDGSFDVTLEADSPEDARNRVWWAAERARATDFLEAVE